MFGIERIVFGVAFGIEKRHQRNYREGSAGPVQVFDWIGACRLLAQKAPSHSVLSESPAETLSDRSNFVGAFSPSSVCAHRGFLPFERLRSPGLFDVYWGCEENCQEAGRSQSG